MQKNFSVSFIGLENLHFIDLPTIRSALLSAKYNEEVGYGFTNVSGSDDNIFATLVKRTPTFIPQIETDTWKIIQKEIYLFSEIDFEIDFSHALLQIFGPIKNVAKVTSYIFPLFGNEVGVKPIQFTASAITKIFVDNLILRSVERLVVNNFQHIDGVSGRYDMRIDKPSLGLEIINKYHEEISKLVLVVNTPKVSQIKITISRNGSLVLKCEESDFSDALEYLKNSLFLKKE